MAYKVLFLDVDGVLHAADAKHRPFRQPCMEVLKTILEESECHVVLSSNWRFDSWGLNKINGYRGGRLGKNMTLFMRLGWINNVVSSARVTRTRRIPCCTLLARGISANEARSRLTSPW